MSKQSKGKKSVHWSTLQKAEERSAESSRVSEELAAVLGVNHQWLVNGTGPREASKSIDRQLQLLPQDEAEDLYDDFANLIAGRVGRRTNITKN